MGGLVQAFSMLGLESLDEGLIRVWIWDLAYACLLVESCSRMLIRGNAVEWDGFGESLC